MVGLKEAKGEDFLSERKSKFSNVVRFLRKNSRRLSLRAKSSTYVLDDMVSKLSLEGRSFRSHSDAPVLKSIVKNQNRVSNVIGQPKGHSIRSSNRRQFNINECNKENYDGYGKSSGESERHKTMELNHVQEDSKANSAFKMRSHPKLSNIHNSNFRLRLYHVLNVVSKPSNFTINPVVTWSRSKPIAINKEQMIDFHGSANERKSFTQINGTRQSMECPDDEDVFVLDI